MFWKVVNNYRFKSLSLVTKLMIFYTISTLAILAAVGLFLYPTFSEMVNQLNGSEGAAIAGICIKKIFIALLISAFGAIACGYWVARNGLKRMREFENKMEIITADSLHERLDLNDWPKELKTLGIRFNMMLDRIETSFIQLSQFSSDIAHELRNPLNNLRGITELALTKENLPQEYNKVLESQMDEYLHLSKLIENLLFLARSDHGQLAVNKKSLNAHDEIANICDYYQAIAEENEIALCYVGEATVVADPTLFKRIISNLLANALKYTPKQGKITVEIKTLDKQLVEISVHDTGIGIGHEHLSKVFDRFYRVDSSRCAQSGGLGLGLAIVKSIVDLHKGLINIESRLGNGTSIYLKLPCSVS